MSGGSCVSTWTFYIAASARVLEKRQEAGAPRAPWIRRRFWAAFLMSREQDSAPSPTSTASEGLLVIVDQAEVFHASLLVVSTSRVLR